MRRSFIGRSVVYTLQNPMSCIKSAPEFDKKERWHACPSGMPKYWRKLLSSRRFFPNDRQII
jgi:hypothetical protein